MTEQANYFRRQRSKLIERLISAAVREHGKASILDVGGTIDYWKGLPHLWMDRPVTIQIVNMQSLVSDDAQLVAEVGDACDMPQFTNNQFDLVHSNSVIEHVGSREKIAQMAAEIRRLAPKHYVQTPNYFFLVEPHFKLPAIHWLPQKARAKALRIVRGQPKTDASSEMALRRVKGINLLTAREMRGLFPDSRIVRERFFGLAKSLIAVRDGANREG